MFNYFKNCRFEIKIMEDNIKIIEWTSQSPPEKGDLPKMLDWSNDDTERLIDLFREQPVLWHSNKTGFKVNAQKSEAWDIIAKDMGRSKRDVRRKMNSLMASFRRERLKRIRSNNPLLPQENDKIKTTWFGYKKMLFMIESDRYRFYEGSFKERKNRVINMIFNSNEISGIHNINHNNTLNIFPFQSNTTQYKTDTIDHESLDFYDYEESIDEHETSSSPIKIHQNQQVRILNTNAKSIPPAGTVIQNLIIESASHDSMLDYIEETNFEQIEDEQNNSNDIIEEEQEEPAVPQPKMLKQEKNPFMIKRRKIVEVPRVEHSYSIPKPSDVVPKKARDGCEIFGEHVAFKLKGYNLYVRNMAQHLINNVLFDADMGKFDSFSQQDEPSST